MAETKAAVAKEEKPVEKKDLPIVMIYKRPPHSYSVAMKTPEGVQSFDFNSKEALCVFLGARNF